MQAQRLKISGMTCGGCVSKVTHALEAITGVSKVAVSLTNAEAEVQYDEQLTSTEQLGAAVQKAGFTVNNTESTQNQKSNGGCCSGPRHGGMREQVGTSIIKAQIVSRDCA